MLQRQIMFKQLQAVQQRQQLQELSDARQQHYLNQLSFLNKHSGLQSPSVNGMPIQDASQMFMGGNTQLSQHGTTPIVQGFPNGYVFSQTQNQPIYSMGLSQQLDMSLYGTPVANSGDDMNSFSHIQGASRDSASVLNMGNNSQLEIPLMQPSTLSNSFVNEQFNPSLDKVCMTDRAFVPKNFGNKNFFGQLLMQASEDGVQLANFQQPDSLQKNASLKVSAMRQEQAGWPLHSVEKTSRLEPSRDAASLDPLEEKILFNTDDSSWESSLGQHSNVDMVGFENNRQHVNLMGSFSSNHSGSWSALMQSAVAEASSSDTAQQEEWSGLTFQNPELSADNDHANYIGNGQQRSWVDNNLQNISSPPSKPEVLLQHSNMNYSFPTFQETDHQVARQKEGMHSDFSHESIQRPQKNVNKWFDCNSQLRLPGEECQLVQTSPKLQNIWNDRLPQHSKNDTGQRNISSYTIGNQPYYSLTGHELKANVWRYESGPQHMVGGSCTPADQASLSWSNQEQGYVNNIADIGMRSVKVHPADTVSSSQVPQVENHNNSLYHESSASQGMRIRMVPPSQQIPRSYSSPLQAHNVTNTSDPWYQTNEMQYRDNSVTFVGNQSPCATFPLATDGDEAKVATLPESCDLFQTSVEDSKNSNKDDASGIGRQRHKYDCFQVGDNSKEVNACSETTQGFDSKEYQVDQLNSCKASTPSLQNSSAHGHRVVTNHLSGANATTAASTSLQQQGFDRVEQSDKNAHVNVTNFEAFDRYLGGPHSLLQNFPLLHQQVNANARQQLLFRLQSGVRNVAQGYTNMNSQLNSISYGENKPMTCSSGSGRDQSGKHFSEAFIQGSQRLLPGETDSHSHPKDQSLINVQMGPSWFKQHLATKNGQMLPISDSMHTITTAKQLSSGKYETFQVIDSIGQEDPPNASQVRSILPNLDITNVTAQHLSGDKEQSLAVLRTKKRKIAACDLLPWHKEVTQSSQPLHKFSSMAESEWALASNRLNEKVEDGAEMMEGSQAKKRLVLTTKLMQQVFRPAPAVILSADACTNIESVVYFVARVALGDACSLTSSSYKPSFTSDMSSKALGTRERVGLLDFSKAAENVNIRAKRLENDFLRMDKTASIVEIKVDSQELEKFSVINRFAKFHSKGHNVSANTSLSSGANPAALKSVPQRYVVAHPMPKVVPEGMNCVSL